MCIHPSIQSLSLSHVYVSFPQALLKGLNLGAHKFEFSSLALCLSLEGKASHRELTSRLLSDLLGKELSQADMARAFDKMLKELPELILDTPEAPKVGSRTRDRTHGEETPTSVVTRAMDTAAVHGLEIGVG